MFLIKFKKMWLKLSIYDVLQNSYNFYLAPLLILQIMPGHKTEYFNCVLCSKRTKPKERRHIDNSIRKYLRKKFANKSRLVTKVSNLKKENYQYACYIYNYWQVDNNFISDFILKQIRWVVESSNARIKRWRYLDRTLPTNQIPFVGDYVRIVCALSNKFFPPLNKGHSIEEDEADAAKMLYLSKQVRLITFGYSVNSLTHERWQIICLTFYRAYLT